MAIPLVQSWKNYDVTPTSIIEKIPLLGKIIKINQRRFPKEVIYGEHNQGNALCSISEADNIFCSHTLRTFDTRRNENIIISYLLNVKILVDVLD